MIKNFFVRINTLFVYIVVKRFFLGKQKKKVTKQVGIFFYFRSDPDPFFSRNGSEDPDPHQNETDSQHRK